jgi:hypothetical protein
MPVVVGVPGLVADDEVVIAGIDNVLEHGEVRHEDLIHPAHCLEGVKAVLVGLALEV